MSEVAILGDLHFGAHASSILHHEYMQKFIDDFFDFVDTNKIKIVLQLGDLFDVRKHVNTWSMHFARTVFIRGVVERNLKVFVILGNHDIFYRDSLEISSVEELLTPYADWFHIIKEPEDVIIGDHSFLLLPWICKENINAVETAIKKSKSKFCAGHFEFNGFEMFKGQMSRTSQTHAGYTKFKKVFSGHYHHKNSRDNVLYVGTPYELTWQDSGTSKGFFTLAEDESLTFHENPYKLYVTLTISKDDLPSVEDVASRILKIRLIDSWEPKEVDALLDRLYSMKPHSIKIVDQKSTITDVGEMDSDEFSAGTGIDIMISEYVSNIQVNETLDRSRLNHVLLEMLAEANNK